LAKKFFFLIRKIENRNGRKKRNLTYPYQALDKRAGGRWNFEFEHLLWNSCENRRIGGKTIQGIMKTCKLVGERGAYVRKRTNPFRKRNLRRGRFATEGSLNWTKGFSDQKEKRRGLPGGD